MSSEWKRAILPSTGKYCDATDLFICQKCGMKAFYYGSAVHDMNSQCTGCKNKTRITTKVGKVTRNNPGPHIRKRIVKI